MQKNYTLKFKPAVFFGAAGTVKTPSVIEALEMTTQQKNPAVIEAVPEALEGLETTNIAYDSHKLPVIEPAPRSLRFSK